MSDQDQAGAAAPDVERLIGRIQDQLHILGLCPSWQDDADLIPTLLDAEAALSAAHTREAEQQEGLAKIGELLQTGGMTDAHYLAGAVRAALEREAALRAENERLDKLAALFLQTDHEFAEKGSRNLAQFRSMASWCDGRLRERGL